jgi:hypothetical protein
MTAVVMRNETPKLGGTLDSYGISPETWGLWLKCWDRDTSKRPTAAKVLEYMSEV